MKQLFTFILLIFPTSVIAEGLTVQQAVDAYYSTKVNFQAIEQLINPPMAFQPLHQGRHCDGPPPTPIKSCLDSACDYLGTYGCDDQHEIEKVARACRGLRDGYCVEASCTRLGQYGCDDFHEIEKVTGLCREVSDGRCIEVACKFLGQYGCDDFREIKKVAAVCKDWVDTDCVESACKRMGDYACDDFHEVKRVIQTCQGH